MNPWPFMAGPAHTEPEIDATDSRKCEDGCNGCEECTDYDDASDAPLDPYLQTR